MKIAIATNYILCADEKKQIFAMVTLFCRKIIEKATESVTLHSGK